MPNQPPESDYSKKFGAAMPNQPPESDYSKKFGAAMTSAEQKASAQVLRRRMFGSTLTREEQARYKR